MGQPISCERGLQTGTDCKHREKTPDSNTGQTINKNRLLIQKQDSLQAQRERADSNMRQSSSTETDGLIQTWAGTQRTDSNTGWTMNTEN